MPAGAPGARPGVVMPKRWSICCTCAFMESCRVSTHSMSCVYDRCPCVPAKQCAQKHRGVQRMKLCMCEVHV